MTLELLYIQKYHYLHMLHLPPFFEINAETQETCTCKVLE